MTWPLFSLLLFAVWTVLLLVLGVGVHRWTRILTGRAGLADWPADIPHGPPHYRRLVRAHANCVENLPVFAALVLVAEAAGIRGTWLDALALSVVAARIGQSLVHAASGSPRATALRFAFFLLQVLAFLAMAALILVESAPRPL